MALSKTVPTSIGVDATYWRIDRAVFNHGLAVGELVINVGGYADKKARDKSSDPVMVKTFYPKFKDITAVGWTDLYDWLILQDDFSGAKNI